MPEFRRKEKWISVIEGDVCPKIFPVCCRLKFVSGVLGKEKVPKLVV